MSNFHDRSALRSAIVAELVISGFKQIALSLKAIEPDSTIENGEVSVLGTPLKDYVRVFQRANPDLMHAWYRKMIARGPNVS